MKKKPFFENAIGISFLVIVFLIAIGVINFNKEPEGNSIRDINYYKESDKSNLQAGSKNEQREETGITGVEVQKDEPQMEIYEFDYDVSDNEVVLTGFDGESKVLEIKPTYEVDGTEYKTNLLEFYLSGSDVETLILYDGISEVNTAMFNMSDVNKVFFPKTMETVYDYTLAYLHPDDGQMIQIYYEGTQDEWSEIFAEYKRTKVEDAEGAEEIGTAIADKINDMIGTEYDSSKFEFFFSASPDDLR